MSKPEVKDLRYQLVIQRLPSEESKQFLCEQIYQSSDPDLLASLSVLPYDAGREFSYEEVQRLHIKLKNENIGHQFVPNVSDRGKISFEAKLNRELAEDPSLSEPNYSSASSKSKKFEINKFNLKKFKLQIIGAGLIILISVIPLALIFMKDRDSLSSNAPAPSTVASINQEFEATLTNTVKRVDFRKRDELKWNSAQRGLKLKHRDSLRTQNDSFASIEYKDGSRINLKENSLVTIGKVQKRKRRLQLDDGSLRAKLSASQKLDELEIQTQKGMLKIPVPEEGSPSAQVETSYRKGKLNVAVASGKAQFMPQSKSLKEVAIQQNEQMLSQEDGSMVKKAFEPSLQIIEPKPGSSLRVEENQNNQLRFAWEDLGEGSQYTWLIATDKNFETILLERKTDEAQLQLAYLEPGTLFWRVVAELEGVRYKTDAIEVNVQQHGN